MTLNPEYWEKIAAHLAGQLSPAEEADINQWRSASPEHEAIFNEAKRIWENSGLKLRMPDDESDELWNSIQQKIEDDKKRRFFILGTPTLLKAAAGFILVAGLTYTFIRRSAPDTTTINAGSEVATVYLPDSTKVWLNVNSTLTYAEDYGTENRTTELAGEAYFQVRRNEQQPFIVSARNASVQVLGTSFNVKEDSSIVVVTVAEGKVKVDDEDSEQDATVLSANEKATVDEKGKVEQSKNTNKTFANWRQLHNPQFEKERLNPKQFLSTQYTWRKNQINQSVIEGKLRNTATLAEYRNIVLKVTYTNPYKKSTTTRVRVMETVRAGETIDFQKRLLDILTDTKSLVVEIESADITTSSPQ
jgi:transmembrane sensor